MIMLLDLVKLRKFPHLLLHEVIPAEQERKQGEVDTVKEQESYPEHAESDPEHAECKHKIERPVETLM